MMRRATLPVASRFAASVSATGLLGTRGSLLLGVRCNATAPPTKPDEPKTTGELERKASWTDPDMTHFRLTTTPHPLYEKPNVVMPRKPKDPAVEHPGLAGSDMPGEISAAASKSVATDASAAAAASMGAAEWSNPTTNAVWTNEELASIQRTHRVPKDTVDTVALFAIRCIRVVFDYVSGYAIGRVTRQKMLRRILFLETLAGIPGMVAGTLRHLESLRRMKRDHGWIHTLLEEAENERMHMLVFMKLYQPNIFFRSMVVVAQGVFWNVFFLAYLVNPRFCHRFVGYLEEEAVRTYSHILELMKSTDPRDSDVVDFGKGPANDIAMRYWKLPADATMYDVVLAVRADEANHRDVNHTFANIKKDHRNPFLDHKQGPAAKHAEEILKR
jgi:hypothetical protein